MLQEGWRTEIKKELQKIRTESNAYPAVEGELIRKRKEELRCTFNRFLIEVIKNIYYLNINYFSYFSVNLIFPVFF